MAAQAALIADTIVGLKRALSKENDYSGPDDRIMQPSNRGNKLRAHANYVREGALGYIHPEKLYKQKIEHAGYTRYILQRNPVRYDSEGDELDDDDEDTEADAAAAEENPFSEIALENLMCPLKHPSELPTHPSMSHPYTSKALREMTRAIEAKLHHERALLWRARNLHRRFLGDSCWMPCGMVETPEDRLNFAPRLEDLARGSPISGDGHSGMGTPLMTGVSQTQINGTQGTLSGAASLKESLGVQDEADHAAETAGPDVEMTDASQNSAVERNEIKNQTKEPKFEEVDRTVGDLPQHTEPKDSSSGAFANGDNPANTPVDQARSVDLPNKNDNEENGSKQNVGDGIADARPSSNERLEEDTYKDVEMADGIPSEPPRRMTTRAQTNAADPHQENESANGPSSPCTETASALFTPHPLFLVPDSILPDPNFGLPPNEAEDTRRLLWSYIQKQEETVRGFEHILECLLRACRMKDDVWEWCKAEGHLGEMSDGEDWYDREKWGLAPGEDLKKGADEDEVEAVDEGRSSGKRGRRRQ